MIGFTQLKPVFGGFETRLTFIKFGLWLLALCILPTFNFNLKFNLILILILILFLILTFILLSRADTTISEHIAAQENKKKEKGKKKNKVGGKKNARSRPYSLEIAGYQVRKQFII